MSKQINMKISETDYGTKAATIKKLKQMRKEMPERFEKHILKYWKRVYMTAIEEVPVETGALRNSIRIQKGEGAGDKYEVGRGFSGTAEGETITSTYYILAGGGGIINPKKGTEVDYGRAVHDGYYVGGTKLVSVPGRKSRKRVGMGRWVAGNPFLDRAIQKNATYLEQTIKEIAEDHEKEWVKDQPQPSPWKMELVVRG